MNWCQRLYSLCPTTSVEGGEMSGSMRSTCRVLLGACLGLQLVSVAPVYATSGAAPRKRKATSPSLTFDCKGESSYGRHG